ncbi:MAG: ABC transporter ATP-binding protein [Bauldia sp.]
MQDAHLPHRRRILAWRISSQSLLLTRRLLTENFRLYAGRYALATLLMASSGIATGASAWIMKDVVNRVFVDKDAMMLWVLPTTIIALALVRGLSLYWGTVTLSRVGNDIVAALQRRLYAHLLTLSINYFSAVHSSELITRIAHNASAARDVLGTVVNTFSRDVIQLVCLIAVMLVQDPAAALILIASVPVMQGFGTGLVKRVRRIAKQGFDASANLLGVMQESVHGIRLVKAYSLEPHFVARMNAAIDENRSRANKMARVSARTGPIAETVAGLAIAGVVLWGGFSVIYRNEQPGEFMSFLFAMFMAYEPAKRLAGTRLRIESGLVGTRMMYELLDSTPTISANETGPALVVGRGEVRLDRVTFGYTEDRVLFRNLDFVAAAGTTTALVGPSGAGKSTVMALIERFHDPMSGRVLIDGQDIAAVRLSTLRQEIAFVSQDVFLFHGTIRDNIAIGRPTASDAEIEAAARAAMAHDFILASADGYRTMVGEHGGRLSGGQRQRIAIARAILKDAKIVLLDEATSALDTESESMVQIAFDRLMRGRTTIVIAHRLSTVHNADRICVMVDGSIVEAGKHAELVAAGGHYAKLYRLQFEPEARAAAAAAAGG